MYIYSVSCEVSPLYKLHMRIVQSKLTREELNLWPVSHVVLTVERRGLEQVRYPFSIGELEENAAHPAAGGCSPTPL